MRKYLFLLLILPMFVSGQITLNASDYTGTYTGTDSLRVTTTTSPFPAMWPFPGAAWDMTITTDSASDIIMYRVPSSFGDYADSAYFSFPVSGSPFRHSVINLMSLASVVENSLNYSNQKRSLTPITLGAADTLYIPQQIATYSSPITVLQFPAIYGSSWGSAAVLNVNFELTVGAFSMFHTPCVKRTYITRQDSVRGWGSMRVRTPAGTPSDFMDVLQVNSTVITVDSFFIDGATSHPALLITGMSQGQRDTTYTQYYYRKGVLRPLATVKHKNGLYTQPERAWIHRQWLTTALVDALKLTELTVSPNPLKKSVTLTLPGWEGETNCRMVDNSGNIIYSFSLSFVGGVALLEIPANIAAGEYLLQVVAAKEIYTTRVSLRP